MFNFRSRPARFSPSLSCHRMRPGRQRWRYQIQFLLLIFFLPDAVNPVKCYCTDDHCVPYGSCDGTVCLVGILRDSNQVIRTCGTNTLGCHK
ncbi:hypothetical protein CRE_19593 [Caenorhabditis remanei]|nr:hypothetical protein CRE_19593 [Caenorhabditis remanei]